MTFCSIDFETASELELKQVGVYNYVRHPSTRVLCFAWAFGDEEPQVWTPGRPLPARGRQHAAFGGAFRAWNAQFERLVWEWIMVGTHGAPPVAMEQWHCTMGEAQAMGLPGKLEKSAEALGTELKDMSGRVLCTRMAKPRKPTTNDPAEWWDQSLRADELLPRLYDYCKQDVRVERAVATRVRRLSRAERQVYLFSERINDRGIPVDLDLVRACGKLVSAELKNAAHRLTEITDGIIERPTQTAKIAKFLGLDSVAKAKLEAFITDDPVKREVAAIRLNAGGAAVKKLRRFFQVVQPDGRVRGQLRYHGAGTGRWSASGGLQIQNFKRPEDGLDIDGYVKAILAGELIDRPALEIVPSLLRAMIRAPDGNSLAGGDYAQIEARVLAWLADQHDLVKLFADGGKVYEDMAAAIFRRPIDEISNPSAERTIGKNSVLGCFGAGTLVVTDRGSVPIVGVRGADRVWDGQGWVRHGGVVYQGKKETINLWRVIVTPDHLLRIGRRWLPSLEAARSVRVRYQMLATALVVSLWSVTRLVLGAVFSGLSWTAIVASGWRSAAAAGSSAGATIVRALRRVPAVNGIGATPILSPTRCTGRDYSTGSPQFSGGAITREMLNTTTTAGVAFGVPGQVASRAAARFSRIWSRCLDGAGRSLNWTVLTTTGATSQTICALRAGARTPQTAAQSPVSSAGSKNWRPVYDIADAGPRNRFTILTARGPLIAHNCGFGMGAKKFRDRYAKDHSLAWCQNVIDTYRSKKYKIPKLWYALNTAVIRAVKNPGVWIEAARGRVKYCRSPDWLYCKLPSGRLLSYYQPRIEPDKWGRDCVSVMGKNPVTRKWERVQGYGGLWCENVVQAVARDIMVAAMFRLESHGYPVIMTVHDDVCTEPGESVNIQHVRDLMAELPAWAAGVPVGVSTYTGRRYGK